MLDRLRGVSSGRLLGRLRALVVALVGAERLLPAYLSGGALSKPGHNSDQCAFEAELSSNFVQYVLPRHFNMLDLRAPENCWVVYRVAELCFSSSASDF